MPTTAVRDSLVDAARALRPTLLAHRDEAERLGHLHPKVVAAAGAAGMFRLTAPRRVGGLQLPLPRAARGVGGAGPHRLDGGVVLVELRARRVLRRVPAPGGGG